MKKLENKTVFITGGLSGIGKACAIAASKEGANIVIADMKSETMDKAMADIKMENPKAMFVDCNVSVFTEVQTAIEKTIATFKTLDVAGIGGEAAKVGDMTEEQWLKVIGVNLNGVFNCMKHELAQMAKQKSGVIINMSSILGKVGFPTSAHYVAAKHAVIGLTQTAALEYATEGIRVNAICPGFIDTPLLSKVRGLDKQHIVDMHPMNRLGKAEEIADGFIFLATSQSSFISGTTIEIDGGYLSK
jgi:NAD(P)-dependent dehydrogenase (short-subunit alcohol dehydrogenase family)